jgi:hypothetical protein
VIVELLVLLGRPQPLAQLLLAAAGARLPSHLLVWPALARSSSRARPNEQLAIELPRQCVIVGSLPVYLSILVAEAGRGIYGEACRELRTYEGRAKTMETRSSRPQAS